MQELFKCPPSLFNEVLADSNSNEYELKTLKNLVLLINSASQVLFIRVSDYGSRISIMFTSYAYFLTVYVY